jgi:hypothetical protein
VLGAIFALLMAAPLHAQAPFYTDDTGVTEYGKLHLEAYDEIDALQSMQFPDLRQNTANLKVNMGLPHGFELDLDAPYITIERTSNTRSSHGVGDTNLGLKWQVRAPSSESRSPGFAMSFYVEMPTGNVRQELGSGETDYWLNLITQFPWSDLTRFNVNLGILFAGNTSTGVVGIETTRGQVYTGGLSMVHDFSSKFSLGGEVYGGIADTTGLDRTQLQAMVGAQYTVHDGITLFMGVVSGTYTGSPRLGGQIGFAIDFPAWFQPPNRTASRAGARLPAHDFLGSSHSLGESNDL